VWIRHNKNPEVLYCVGLGDFFTLLYCFYAKLFLENSSSNIKNFYGFIPCPENQNRQGFLGADGLKLLTALHFSIFVT